LFLWAKSAFGQLLCYDLKDVIVDGKHDRTCMADFKKDTGHKTQGVLFIDLLFLASRLTSYVIDEMAVSPECP
jgi:hypothetical protein